MILDIRTLSYATATVFLVTSAATWYVYGTQRRFPGSGLWTVGMNVAAMAFLLLGLRDHVPEYLSGSLGNASLVFALALQYHAVVRFNGIRKGLSAVYAVAGLFTLAFALGSLLPLTTGQRSVLHWTAAATVYALCAWTALAHCRGRAARILLGVPWALTAAMAAGRGVATALHPEAGDFMLAGPVHGAAFIFLPRLLPST
jgi:hypothetical protein